MSGRRVIVTGVSGFLGAMLTRVLETSSEVDFVAGVAVDEPLVDFERAEFIRADIRSPLIHRVLSSASVDTVVHADLSSSPLSFGGRSAQKEHNVIGTMQLLGACQRIEKISKVVVRSSTAVYGSDVNDPSILDESWSNRAHSEHGYTKDVMDAETFARDFGRRRPDVTLTILRMANVVGPTAETNITQFFGLPIVPTALGFDPRLQLLHSDDAIEVLKRAVIEDHPGVFNVAGDGVAYLSQAIRIARRLPVPIIASLATAVGDLLRRFGGVDFPTDQIALIVRGRVVDNSRLKEVFGYTPRYSTLDALRDFLRSRSPVGKLFDWEKELYSVVEEAADRLRGSKTRTRPHIVSAASEG